MESRLQQLCLNSQKIQELIFRCELRMSQKEQETLRIRESYEECTKRILRMAVERGSGIDKDKEKQKQKQKELREIYEMINGAYKKIIQVVQFYLVKPGDCRKGQRDKQLFQETEDEWMEVEFGDALIDKNGNLIKNIKGNKKKSINIYQELESDSYDLIERLRQTTEQKIQSLNTHIINNELKQLSNYFDNCKNNFMKFFMDQNKEIDEIWKRSKQSYEPTMKLMGIWKEKLQGQLQELRAKMNRVEVQLQKKSEENGKLREKLEAYNVFKRQHGTQTPGLYDYRVLELNQQERMIHIQSKRLFDLISSYEGMLKEQFKLDQTKYKRVKDDMMKSMQRIRMLELQNTQMRQNFQRQKERDNEGNRSDLYNEQTFQLLKELRTMSAFQRQMYNSAIVKFINGLKKMSQNSMNQEMVVTMGLEGQTLDLRLDRKMFISMGEEEKNILNEIHQRRSKITQFNMEKIKDNLQSFKNKYGNIEGSMEEQKEQDISDRSENINRSKSRSKNKKNNKMKSLELRGKKIGMKKQQNIDKTKYQDRLNQHDFMKKKKSQQESESQTIQNTIQEIEQQSRFSNTLTRSTKRDFTQKCLGNVEEVSSKNSSEFGSKQSLAGTPVISRESSRQRHRQYRSNQPSFTKMSQNSKPRKLRKKNSLKIKIQVKKAIQNSIIIQQPVYQNIRTDPVKISSHIKPFELRNVSVQTQEPRMLCTFCGNKDSLEIKQQILKQSKYQQKQQICLKEIGIDFLNSPKQEVRFKENKERQRQREKQKLKEKESRLWTPSALQSQQNMVESRVLRKSFNQKAAPSSKFILNRFKDSSKNKKTSDVHKLSINIESLQNSRQQKSRNSSFETLKKHQNSNSNFSSIPQFKLKTNPKTRDSISSKLWNISNMRQPKKYSSIKHSQMNTSKLYNSLIEDSVNQLRSPQNIGIFQQLGEFRIEGSVQQMMSKFKQFHLSNCKEVGCSHLQRFYQNLRRIQKSGLGRKSPLPLKTLKIQRIEHC